MAYLVWTKDKYGCGIDEIDEQHRGLFEALNRLLGAMTQGKGKGEVAGILDFLEGYVKTHFVCEEAHMDRLACSSCAENKAAHEEFLKNFVLLKGKFKTEGASQDLVLWVQQTLCDWFERHIWRVDTKLRETAPGPDSGSDPGN